VEDLNDLLDQEFYWKMRCAERMGRFFVTLKKLDPKFDLGRLAEWRLENTSETWFPYSRTIHIYSTRAGK
jgi:hypothetical protein